MGDQYESICRQNERKKNKKTGLMFFWQKSLDWFAYGTIDHLKMGPKREYLVEMKLEGTFS